MTKRIISLLIICLISTTTFAQNNSKFCKQIQALKTVIVTHHYVTKPINDSLSKQVQKLFIEKLDEDKDYFLEKDINTFLKDTYSIDDYIVDGTCDFTNTYTNILELRYKQSIGYLEDLKTTTIDYSGSINMVPVTKDDYAYYTSLEQLKQVLIKKIGFKTLSELLLNKKNITYKDATFTAEESIARLAVIDREICKINEFLNRDNGVQEFVQNQFLNAYLNYFDPHSTYFNTNEKDAYQSGLSTNQESFGLEINKNKNGELTVAYITPGSAAYKNGKINEDDIILELKSNGDNLKTNCLPHEALFAFLNTEKHTKTTFVLRDKNNSIKQVSLTKSLIKVTENVVKGFVIGDSLKIGYIKIPSFYTNFDSPNGRGLAADVAKELYKLQREKIQGLIIDLQFNGGGSMQEAINLSGIFIDKGPLSILKFKDNSNYTIRDPKRGSFFNKPIAVIVNQYSASASEFFAAAMQDYKRAIIVGSKTFGKGTAQNIMPLKENTDLGFAKITVETFFRVSGASHQEIGIIPDVKLPSVYQKINDNEATKPFVIKNDTVTARLKVLQLKQKDLKPIITSSNLRISRNDLFVTVNEQSDLLYNYVNKSQESYKLTLANIKAITKKRKSILDKVFTINENVLFTIKNTASTLEILSYNEDSKKENDYILQELSKDIYINETYNILNDYINLN